MVVGPFIGRVGENGSENIQSALMVITWLNYFLILDKFSFKIWLSRLFYQNNCMNLSYAM